jgi:predicted tellurium resistance membrane protein TerC
MIFKFVAGLIAAALVLAFLLPPAIKLKDLALAIVIGIGVVMMLVDLYQSLRRHD